MAEALQQRLMDQQYEQRSVDAPSTLTRGACVRANVQREDLLCSIYLCVVRWSKGSTVEISPQIVCSTTGEGSRGIQEQLQRHRSRSAAIWHQRRGPAPSGGAFMQDTAVELWSVVQCSPHPESMTEALAGCLQDIRTVDARSSLLQPHAPTSSLFSTPLVHSSFHNRIAALSRPSLATQTVFTSMTGEESKQAPCSSSPTQSEPVLRPECNADTEVAPGPRTSSTPGHPSVASKPVHPDCSRKPVTSVDRSDFVAYVSHIQSLSVDLFGLSGDTGYRSCKTHSLDPLTSLGRQRDFANPNNVQVKDIQSIFNEGIDAEAPLPTETDWKFVLKSDGIQPGGSIRCRHQMGALDVR